MSQGNIKIIEKQFANAQLLPEIVKMIDEGHTVTIRLKGVSMRPFLENGRDKALLTKPVFPLRVGEAVLAEISTGHYVLHRIIMIDGENITLRGDGNIGIESCKYCDIKGTVIGFYRKGRDRMDSTNGIKWRIYSQLWMWLFPIRRYLLAIYRRYLRIKEIFKDK